MAARELEDMESAFANMDLNASSPSDPSLPGLPGLATELILMIVEDLEPGDHFNLSQTNRRLREIFWQENWTAGLSALPYHKRLEFWTTVTRGHPQLVVRRSSLGMGRPCVGRLNVGDIPYFSIFGTVKDPASYIINSTLRRAHIRTALKLHRLGAETDYLNRILAATSRLRTIEVPKDKTKRYPRARDVSNLRQATDPDAKIRLRFESRARIIDGRVLLHVDLEASGEWELMPGNKDERRSLCPHNSWSLKDSEVSSGVIDISSHPYSSWFLGDPRISSDTSAHIYGGRAPRDPPARPTFYRLRGGCDSCLTDYDVAVEFERFSMQVWYDLGGEGDEDDVCFAAHLNQGCSQFGVSGREHGTVEKLFDSGSKK